MTYQQMAERIQDGFNDWFIPKSINESTGQIVFTVGDTGKHFIWYAKSGTVTSYGVYIQDVDTMIKFIHDNIDLIDQYGDHLPEKLKPAIKKGESDGNLW